MKKTMIFAAMAAVALSSCSKNEMEGPDIQSGSQLAEINIGQTVQGFATKAAINKGDRVEATIIATNGPVADDYNWASFVPTLENKFTVPSETWAADKFANVSTGTFEAGTDMVVGLNPSLYANPLPTTQGGAQLIGVAPKGTVENGKVLFSLQDGQQDVMIAQLTAHNASVFTNGQYIIDPFKLTFDHKTAQLRFRFAAVNTKQDGEWKDANIKVKSVTVKKAYVPSGVQLAKESKVVWNKTPQNLMLDNFTTNEVPATFGTAIAGKPDFITVDKQALVKPGETVELDVMLTIDGKEKSYTGIKPTKVGESTPLVTAEGMYHNISLKVTQPIVPTGSPEIVATATVNEWGVGDEGEAELK